MSGIKLGIIFVQPLHEFYFLSFRFDIRNRKKNNIPGTIRQRNTSEFQVTVRTVVFHIVS